MARLLITLCRHRAHLTHSGSGLPTAALSMCRAERCLLCSGVVVGSSVLLVLFGKWTCSSSLAVSS